MPAPSRAGSLGCLAPFVPGAWSSSPWARPPWGWPPWLLAGARPRRLPLAGPAGLRLPPWPPAAAPGRRPRGTPQLAGWGTGHQHHPPTSPGRGQGQPGGPGARSRPEHPGGGHLQPFARPGRAHPHHLPASAGALATYGAGATYFHAHGLLATRHHLPGVGALAWPSPGGALHHWLAVAPGAPAVLGHPRVPAPAFHADRPDPQPQGGAGARADRTLPSALGTVPGCVHLGLPGGTRAAVGTMAPGGAQCGDNGGRDAVRGRPRPVPRRGGWPAGMARPAQGGGGPAGEDRPL